MHTLISPASIALSRYRYVLIDAASLMSNSQASSIVHAQIVLMIIEVTCDPYNIVPCVSIYCMHVGFEVQMNACMNTHLCIYIYAQMYTLQSIYIRCNPDLDWYRYWVESQKDVQSQQSLSEPCLGFGNIPI